jgi:hypothetical protein
VGALVIVTLLPSYLLFQSGGLKESVLLFGVGTLFHSINRISRTKIKWEGLLVAIIGCWFLINIKPYFIASIVPATLAYAIALKLKSRHIFSWAIWTLNIVSGTLIISLSNFELLEFIVRKQHDFLNYAANIQPGSLIYIPRLEYTWESVTQSLPQSFWRTIMEPMPWSIHTLSLFIMFVENVIILAVVSIGSFRLIKNGNLSLTSHFLIQSIIPGLCLIVLISPVLGAAMRYRSPFIILLLLAFVPLFIYQKAKNSHNEV